MIFGTRPEAIKMAPLYKALSSSPSDIETKVCVTAQHREMLDQVLDVFNINADFDLDLMASKQDLFDVTVNVLSEIKTVLISFKPDIVMVHGDTTTAFASSMACFYLNIPVWHIEAGLRTNDLRAPFPEEFNRQMISKIASKHLAPTESSRNNLLSEGIDSQDILVTGNTVIDALFLVLRKLKEDTVKQSHVLEGLSRQINFDITKEDFILITGHRRENFGEGFKQICEALLKLSVDFPKMNFVYPVHLNPNVKTPVNDILGNSSNIYLINPVDYESFVLLMKNCFLVLTDSGGIQEEAPSIGKPVLVLRDVTERPEAIEAGTVSLVGTDPVCIYDNVRRLIENKNLYLEMSNAHNPYGDGNACKRIISLLEEYFHG